MPPVEKVVTEDDKIVLDKEEVNYIGKFLNILLNYLISYTLMYITVTHRESSWVSQNAGEGGGGG